MNFKELTRRSLITKSMEILGPYPMSGFHNSAESIRPKVLPQGASLANDPVRFIAEIG